MVQVRKVAGMAKDKTRIKLATDLQRCVRGLTARKVRESVCVRVRERERVCESE